MNVVIGRPYIPQRRQKHEVFHVQNARRLVGALQLAPQPREVPRFAVRHGGVGDALEQMAAQADGTEHLGQRFGLRHLPVRLNAQVHAVHLLPHFG